MENTLLQISSLEWHKLLFGEEDLKFLIEVSIRTSIMFFVILIALMILGKRGIAQLSVFELIVILSLGSAAGDSTFYKNVGLLPVILVFVIVILLYKTIIFIIGKSKKMESLLEGKPVYLIKNGKFNLADFNKEALAYDEFFSEMRVEGVSQLGQVDKAIVETNGQLSIFYFKDEEVKFGLPILPEDFNEQYHEIKEETIYSCINCGNTEKLGIGLNACKICNIACWVKSKNDKRIR